MTTPHSVKNNAYSTLASGISDVATSLTVATGEGARFPDSGKFYIPIDEEIIEVQSRTDDTFDITGGRGAQGTVAAAHSAGAEVNLYITAGEITELQDAIVALEAIDSVLKTTYNANTILKADADDTPEALEVTEQTIVGRITGSEIKALSVAELQALLFSAALPENLGIKFDEALSADGKYSGFVTSQFKAGAALAFGEVVYLAVADDRWEKAKADAIATTKPLIGVCVLVAAGDGSDTTVLLLGKVRADAIFPSFTKYDPVYISAATAGLLTSTAPGSANFMRSVGHALSADELWFNPSPNTFTVE